jgi:transcriptional regulator with XRE-family HTH domain
LTWKQRLARLFRALAGLTQSDFGERTGVDPILIDRYEQGKAEPSPDTLQRQAQGTGLTVQAGDEILLYADTLRRPRQRAGLGRASLVQELKVLESRVSERLLRLPPPPAASSPRAEDRRHAEALWAQLKDLPADQQLAVVRVGRDFQSWALAERCRDEAETQASRQLEGAASLARLAQEIADRVPPSWRAGLQSGATRLR